MKRKIEFEDIVGLIITGILAAVAIGFSIPIIIKNGLLVFIVGLPIIFPVFVLFVAVFCYGLFKVIHEVIIGIRPKVIYLVGINEKEKVLLFKTKKGKLITYQGKEEDLKYQEKQFYDAYIKEGKIESVIKISSKSFPLKDYRPNLLVKYFKTFYGPHGAEYDGFYLILIYEMAFPVFVAPFTGSLDYILASLIGAGIPLIFILIDAFYKMKFHYFKKEED